MLAGVAVPARVRAVRAEQNFRRFESDNSTKRAAEIGDRNWGELAATTPRRRAKGVGAVPWPGGEHSRDGFLIAFDGPGRAIRCAMNISRQLRSLGIEIRAGLHSGECETVGTNLGGIAVHIGSRVAGTANAGEILVSSTPLVSTEKQATAPAGKEFAGHGCCQKSNYVAQI